MSKQITLTSFLLWMLIVIFFSGLANAGDVTVELKMADEATVETVGKMGTVFGQHFENADLLLNGQIIGTYKLSGFGTRPDDAKNVELFFQINGMGYLFMKLMTNSTTPDFFEGIIIGGTGSLLGYEGTVSGNIPQRIGVPVSVTLHFP